MSGTITYPLPLAPWKSQPDFQQAVTITAPPLGGPIIPGWVEAGGIGGGGGGGGAAFADAPVDGALYGRLNGTWAVAPGSPFPEAPVDGQLYVRRGSTATWVVAPLG